MIEKFKPVQGYAGIYEISNMGRVKSLSRVVERKDGNTRVTEDRIILPFITKAGYHQIALTNKDGVRKNITYIDLSLTLLLRTRTNYLSLTTKTKTS